MTKLAVTGLYDLELIFFASSSSVASTAQAVLLEIHEIMVSAIITSVGIAVGAGNTDTSPSTSNFGAIQGLGVELFIILFQHLRELWVAGEVFSLPDRGHLKFQHYRLIRCTGASHYLWATTVRCIAATDTAFIEDLTLD
jgi:hypothetical protein